MNRLTEKEIKEQQCSLCKIPFTYCEGCGQAIKETTGFCRYCGKINERSQYIFVGGVRYFKGDGAREPDPKATSTYDFCCCGTPFAFDARYCQFCGRKRPKRGQKIKRNRLPAVKPVCKGPREVRIAPAPEPRSFVSDIAPFEEYDLITEP